MDNKFVGELSTDAYGVTLNEMRLAHIPITAAQGATSSATGVHAAFTCTTPLVSATCVVKAASAETDILTVTAPAALGSAPNDLSINLTTAADDNLAVSAVDATGVITIALAKTTAANNTAALIQAAIRALGDGETEGTVSGIDVTGFTCAAGGNWDTAAVATGETGAVDFSGGQDAAADVLTTDITNPPCPRNLTATSGGTVGDIGAVRVTVTGTNIADQVISETLPAFTANSASTVTGSLAFKTVTSISIPAHDGTGATTAIGFGELIGLPYMFTSKPLAFSLDDGVIMTAPTFTIDSDEIEKNVIDLNGSLDGSVYDIFLAL